MPVSKRMLTVTSVLAIMMASGKALNAKVDTGQEQFQLQDSKRLVVEASPLTIHLWETMGADGKTETMFAFEEADGTVSGVSKQRPVLHLRGGAFDPLDRPVISDSRIRANADTELFIVQYVTTPRSEYRKSLEGMGVSILPGYLPDQACVVRMSADVRDRVEALPWVRWVGAVEPEMKLAPGLGIDSIKDGETLPVRVRIQPPSKASQAELADIAESHGSSVQWVHESGSSVDLVVNRDAFLDVLRSDATTTASLIHEVKLESADSRVMSGVDTLEVISGSSGPGYTGPYSGIGVRAEICDKFIDESNVVMQNLVHDPIVRYNSDSSPFLQNAHPRHHGTATYSNLFAKVDPALFPEVAGILPNAEGIFNSFRSFSSPFPVPLTHLGLKRDCVTQPLMQDVDDPATQGVIEEESYRAVLQSNSYNLNSGLSYTDESSEVDKIAFYYDFLILHGTGNSGATEVGSESIAKNALTVGGVLSGETPGELSDDSWGTFPGLTTSPGIGPVDVVGGIRSPGIPGRIKPDLAQKADAVWSAIGFNEVPGDNTPDAPVAQVSGVSFATPVIAGSAGLAFEMWGRQYPLGLTTSTENIFGHALTSTTGDPWIDVFANRPGPAVIKALLINTASPYDWNVTNSTITRDVQGWGLPDHVKLFKRALWDRDSVESLTPCVASQSYPPVMHVLNESAILSTVGTEYSVCFEVLPTDTELRATLVWSDPPPSELCGGSPLVNDLDLTVIAPDGTTVYLGNSGLVEDGDPGTNHGIWSAPGGDADELNNVENVFIDAANLQSGVYQIKAKLVTLCDDGNVPIWTGCTGDEADSKALPTGGVHDVKFAIVVTRGPCDADFNQDGVVDAADATAFQSAFASDSKRADLTNDGHIDFIDISEFVTRISAGCP